jgi:hypothetical protein
MEAGHSSWLHHLYLGSSLLERGNQNDSAVYFAKSLALKPNIHAARALAVSAPDLLTAKQHYLEVRCAQFLSFEHDVGFLSRGCYWGSRRCWG